MIRDLLSLVPLAGDAPLLLLVAKATIILLAALAITVVMQRTSAGARHLVWLVTLAALLVVPALAAWAPLRLEILPPAPARAASAQRAAIVAPGTPATAVAAAATDAAAADAAADAPIPAASRAPWADASPLSLLLALWSVVALGIVAWLAWGALSVRRIVRRAAPLDSADWRTPLYEVADRLELAEPPRLLRSDDAPMPFACGFLTPTIVLPADCVAWSLDRRQAVLLHELAHVKRRDLVGHTLGRLACALYWFHPLAWTAAKRLRSESERACDDLALAAGAKASDYAEHLLDIVTSVRVDRTPAVALAMARRREFEGRMLAILDREPRTAAPSRRQSAALIAALALMAVVVGAASPAPRAPRPAAIVTVPTVAVPLDAAPSPDAARTSEVVLDTRARQAVPRAPLAGAEGTTAKPDAAAKPAREEKLPAPAPRSAPSREDIIAAALAANGIQVDDADAPAGARRTQQASRAAADDERATLLAKVLASDSSTKLRRVAAWGLAEYAEEPVATKALATALRRDASASVREMAAWALANGSEGSSDATDALGAALRGDADPRVRTIAAWALGNVGGREAVEPLLAALADSSRAVRVRTIWALGNADPRQAPPRLVAMLKDADPGVRKVTAWALYQIEDPASAPALDAALRAEKDKELQMAYIRALAVLGEKSVDAIRNLLQASDPDVRAMAVHALAGGRAAGPWPWPWPEPRPYP